ncbi:DUF1501 domain-containing protein [Falsiroseomonas sp. HW251]|uniref:DUF1501 domain-containing protein n=1 Tax=Falsiroseomonas sp. HW251 TaxID=3390998 RepID=UPI003D310E2D
MNGAPADPRLRGATSAGRTADAGHASFSPTRRSLLLGLWASIVVGGTRAAFGQAPGDRRLVVILLRGAMDGLHVVEPYGDPDFAELRPTLRLPEPGQENGLLDLGGTFGLHPALANLHGLYRADQALIVHAVAGPYRSRSHFEAQDMLEAGGDQRLTSGWLNRALQGMTQAGQARTGLAVGTGVPLLLRGPAPVGAYAPPGLDRPQPDLMLRLAALQDADPALGPLFREGLRARGFAEQTLGPPENDPERGNFPRLAAAAARLLAEPQGPRVAALEIGGWDTHAGQVGRIMGPLRALDAGIAQLQAGLGAAWAQTAVLVITEFGRTARANGNNGTDHGTAGVAFLLGGAVAGGRVATDWPGLKPDSLLDNRDLRPTTDLRAVAKALLQDHLRLPPAAVAQAFPGSGSAAPVRNLIRA